MRKRTSLYFMLLLIVVIPVFSQDTTDESDEDDEKTISKYETRREVLLYGIDSGVLELVSKLKAEKNTQHEKELVDVLERTIHTKLKTAILELFTETSMTGAKGYALDVLEDPYDEDDSVIISCIRYLSEIKVAEAHSLYVDILEMENEMLVSAAIRALGLSQDESFGPVLLTYLDEYDNDGNLKNAVIKAIGNLQYNKALDELIDILQNEYEEKSPRWNAAESIGKIGGEKALQTLINMYSDEDANLRSHIIKALGNFNDKSVQPVLIEALRDSFWRIRVNAAKSLGETGNPDAVPILKYKAEKDPEKNVQYAAITALARIGTNEALFFLIESIIKNKRKGLATRETAFKAILDNKPKGNITNIMDYLIKEEWNHEESRILEKAAHHLSFTKAPVARHVVEKLVSHPYFIIQIYGIRIIGLNRLGMTGVLKKMSDNTSIHPAVSQEAEQILKEF